MPECDITKTGVVLDLLQTAEPLRDAIWRNQFYDAVVTASFRCGDPQVAEGPDGFPYFRLLSPEPFVPFESFCISNLLEMLSEQGFGIALNQRPTGSVDWVFSYGDIVTLRLFKAFEVPGVRPPNLPAKEVIKRDEAVLVGQPSEGFLPSYCRRVLKDFLETRVRVKNPGVFLMHRPSDDPPQQLVFSVFPEDFSSAEKLNDVLGRISWFLPRHYPVVAIDRSSDLVKSFRPLWAEDQTSSGKRGKPWYRFWS